MSINKKHFFIFLVLSGLVLFSAMRSSNIDAAIVIVINLIANFLFFFIFCNLVKSPKVLSLTIVVLAISFFISTLISINVDVGVIVIDDSLNEDLRFDNFRQSGFLRNPNRYGYFALLIFWCGMILHNLKLTSNKLSLVIMLLGAFAVILSLSRGVILGLSLGLLYYLMMWNAKRTIIGISVSSIIIFSVFTFQPTNQEEQSVANTLVSRFQPDTLLYSGSTSVRTSLWIDAIDRYDENPLLGVPLGSLEGVIGKSGNVSHEPHNTFLYILQYFGLIGLMVIIIYFLWLLSIFLSTNLNKKVRSLLIIFSFSMLIPSMFHTTLTFKPTLLMFCLIASILRFSRSKSLPNRI